MATKENLLEQIVEEHRVHKGYFVQHNLKLKELGSGRPQGNCR